MMQSNATIGCFKNMRESTLLLYFGSAKKKLKNTHEDIYKRIIKRQTIYSN